MTASKGRRRGLNVTLPQVLAACGLVLGIAVISSFTQKMEQTRSIKAEGSRLSAVATSLMMEQEALRVTQAYVESDAFTRREGPAVLKYMPASAHLVVVLTATDLPEGSAPVPTPIPEQVQRENWQIWRQMFFYRQED